MCKEGDVKAIKLSKIVAIGAGYVVGTLMLGVSLDILDILEKNEAFGVMLMLWAIGVFVLVGVRMKYEIEDDMENKS